MRSGKDETNSTNKDYDEEHGRGRLADNEKYSTEWLSWELEKKTYRVDK